MGQSPGGETSNGSTASEVTPPGVIFRVNIYLEGLML